MTKILIVYHSQYKGNTKQMAELVAQGCQETKDVEVKLINVNEARVSIAELEACDGLALGTPDYFTYMAGGLKQFFDDAKIADYEGREVTGKPYVAFVTHGGGGGAIDSVEKCASSMKFEKVADSALVKDAPTGDDVERSIELGRALARRVVNA